MQRMWINQPSTLQPLHKLHGRLVIASGSRVWFVSGDVISQEVPPNVLSHGWPNHLRVKEAQLMQDVPE